VTPDARLLHALRTRAGTDSITLARDLGLSLAEWQAKVAEWRSLGFDISEHPHGGCHLNAAPDVLVPEDVQSLLHGTGLGDRVLVFQETASTNDIAEREARNGAPAGLVVLAERQTSGRGRLGRVWESRPGLGLWLSVVLKTDAPLSSLGRLTMAAAVAIVQGVESLCPARLSIKWPNDVHIDGRKLAGLLAEAQVVGDRVTRAIIGIGLNVNHGPDDFSPELTGQATSLRQACGDATPRRADVAAAVLSRLAVLQNADAESLLAVWRDRCVTLGRRVRVDCGAQQIEGVADSVGEDGCLWVRLDSGALEAVHAGDVMHFA
jgi:BirA family biotin operon repressor/biotin-[acetyl-CoA-carboxylase] ligase